MGAVDISSRPAQAVLSIVKGDQWVRTLRFRQQTSSGLALDLTGAVLSAAVFKSPGGQKEADVPITVAVPSSGDAVIDLDESLTSTLSAESYRGDPAGCHWIVVKLVDSQAVTKTLLQIKLTVTAA